jgi:hypothetical protein
VCEFGSAPNSTGEAQNIFERVFNWTCTSRPMVARYFTLLCVFVEALDIIVILIPQSREKNL